MVKWFAGPSNVKANICMAHRYLYYVEGTSVVSDEKYDALEKEALVTADKDHPLFQVGSSSAESYHQKIIQGAKVLLDPDGD